MTPSEFSHLSARKWFLTAFLLSGIFWVFDSVIVFLFVQNSHFLDQLLSPGAERIYYRVCILIALCVAGSFRYLDRDDWSLSVAESEAEEMAKAGVERDVLENVFDHSPLAMMTLDELGFLDCNQATLDMFGIPLKDEFSSIHPGDISPPKQPNGSDSMSEAFLRIEKALREGSTRFEWVHKRKGGECFWAIVTLTRYHIGSKQRIYATVEDVSALKKLDPAFEDGQLHRQHPQPTPA